MRLPASLPEPFRVAPFAVSAATSSGISPERLRRRDLDSPFWGVRVPGEPIRSFEALCIAFAVRMPADAFFSHLTAARIFGMPVASRFAGDERLHVGTPPPRRAVRGRGVRGHQLTGDPSEIVIVRDLPLTSPARTWIDLARGMTIEELVVLGDYLLSWRHPLTTHEHLAEAVRSAAGRRGVSNAALALPYLSDRSDSPPESQFRYRFAQAGLPPAIPNKDILTSTGGFLAMPDLMFEEYHELFDYEGDHHRTDEHQWNKDIARVRTLEAHGWHSTRGSKADLRDSSAVIKRMELLLTSKGWRR